MVSITLTDAEAILAAAVLDVCADSYASTLQDEAPDWESRTAEYVAQGPQIKGTTLEISDPRALLAQDALWRLSIVPVKDDPNSKEYDPHGGYEVDDICNLARKLREAGVTEPKPMGVPEGPIVRTLDELPSLDDSFLNLWEGLAQDKGNFNSDQLVDAVFDMVLQTWEISQAITGDDLRKEIHRRLMDWLKRKQAENQQQ
jgi:hypothetical protein